MKTARFIAQALGWIALALWVLSMLNVIDFRVHIGPVHRLQREPVVMTAAVDQTTTQGAL